MIYANSLEKYVGNRMIYQGLVVCLLLLFIYSDLRVYYSVLGIIIFLIGLKIITLYRNEDKTKRIKIAFIYYSIYLIIALFFIFQKENLLFKIMDDGFSQFNYPFDLNIDFLSTWKTIFEYFGLLTIISFSIEFGVTIYYWRSKFQINPEDLNKTQSLFEYFLSERSAKKWFLLIGLLLFASIYEEMMYRYFMINILIFIGSLLEIPLVISIYGSILIASFSFGMAHFQNGGWSYVLNSLFAGIIFSLCFIWYGIVTSWILHLLWNLLIVFQTLLAILWKEKVNAGIKISKRKR